MSHPTHLVAISLRAESMALSSSDSASGSRASCDVPTGPTRVGTVIGAAASTASTVSSALQALPSRASPWKTSHWPSAAFTTCTRLTTSPCLRRRAVRQAWSRRAACAGARAPPDAVQVIADRLVAASTKLHGQHHVPELLLHHLGPRGSAVHALSRTAADCAGLGEGFKRAETPEDAAGAGAGRQDLRRSSPLKTRKQAALGRHAPPIHDRLCV